MPSKYPYPISPPLCPHCGIPMEKRSGRLGVNNLMQKIILLLLFIIFPTYFSNASFLSDSSTYCKLSSSIDRSYYVNGKAFKILRYDPPYYAIQGNAIVESFEDNNIYCGTYIFFYDFTKQEMKAKLINVATYDSYGNTLDTHSVNESAYFVPANSMIWSIGNFYFYRIYHIFFDKTINAKLGIQY